MSKSKLWLKIFVPVLILLLMALLAETLMRLFGVASNKNAEVKWRMKDQMALLIKASALYPPTSPLFNTSLKDRPMLEHKNYPVLGASLREYQYDLKKPDNAYRIIGLGDSFAWGWGVLDNRRTFFKLLECWLQKENPAKTIELINASKPGAEINYYQDFLDSIGWGLNPDKVVISFNLNDSYISYVSRTVDSKTAARMGREQGFWTRHSRLIRFIWYRIIQHQVRREYIESVHDAYLGANRSLHWERAQGNLRSIANECKKRKVGLIVVVFPLLFDLDRKYPFVDEMREIVKFLGENGFEYIDLLPTYLGKKSELLWTKPWDTHPNEVAHRMAAETIFKKLNSDVKKSSGQ